MRTMRTQHDQRVLKGRAVQDQHQPGGPAHDTARHGGHGWMMIACCIPMLAIAVILVATGAANPAFLGIAVGCTLMMALMMGGMSHGGGDGGR